MREIDPERMRYMEACGRDIAAALGRAIDKFNFNGPEFTWISNAQRADMVKALQEFIQRNPPDQTSADRN